MILPPLARSQALGDLPLPVFPKSGKQHRREGDHAVASRRPLDWAAMERRVRSALHRPRDGESGRIAFHDDVRPQKAGQFARTKTNRHTGCDEGMSTFPA